MGIEPTQPAWKASVLPLNYTRKLGAFPDDDINYIIYEKLCQVFLQKKRNIFSEMSVRRKIRRTVIIMQL